MEDKIDINYLKINASGIKDYLKTVTSKGCVCVAPHKRNVAIGNPAALLCRDIMDKDNLSLADLNFLVVTKNLTDLHIYCEVCGKRIKNLKSESKFCSVECRKKCISVNDNIKTSIKEKNEEFETLRKALVSGIKKECTNFDFADIKEKLNDITNYLSSIKDSKGYCNMSIHRKNLIKKDPMAILVEQILYKYDFSLRDLNILIGKNFKVNILCPTCGKRIKDLKSLHCSISCMKKDPLVQAKYEKTCIERYGVKNAAASNVVQEKIRQTNFERHGVEYIFQSEEVKNKTKETWLEKYGESSPMRVKEIKDKVKETCIERYGAKCAFQSESIKAKIMNTVTKSRRANKYNGMLKVLEAKNLCMLTPYEDYLTSDNLRFKCLTCGNEFVVPYSTHIQFQIVCENCYTNKNSHGEGEIFQYIREIVPNVEILRNKRKLFDGTEIDFYIPAKNLAIEYNGDYWHSSNLRTTTPTYHLAKTLKCQEKGIQLMHIFEHEWIHKKDIIKSILAAKLGIYKTTIFARKCQVRLLNYREYYAFLENNHLQGYASAKYKLGLFYKDELVACLGVGASRFKPGETEVIRFCVKKNTKIIGGLSKLIKHFHTINPTITELYSYLDRKCFNGNGYEKVGFTLVSASKPGYVYIKDNQILSRLQCQKHLLPALLGKSFDPNLTEAENMAVAKYSQIYDCGMLKYVYKF